MAKSHEEFMRSFISAEPKLRAYALSCGLSIDHVDDLVQGAALVLWRRYADYDPVRPFVPWALGVAHRLVQEAYRSQAQSAHLLSPEVAGRLADTCGEMAEEIDSKREALRRCVEKLTEPQRAVLHSRYAERLPLAVIARQLNKGLSAANMVLHRIRLALLRCVEREVAA